MMRCVWRWWRRARRLGWTLLITAVVTGTLVVLFRGLAADLAAARLSGPDAVPAELRAAADAFDRWVGWANIAALPMGLVGTVIVLIEKLARARSTVTDATGLAGELTAAVHNTLRSLRRHSAQSGSRRTGARARALRPSRSAAPSPRRSERRHRRSTHPRPRVRR